MNKIVNAVKKAVAPKKVAVKKVVEAEEPIISDVCKNCGNSGRECNVCLQGKDVV